MRRISTFALVLLGALAVPTPGHAGLETIRTPLIMNELKAVSIRTGGVHVTGYRFTRLTRAAVNLFKPGAGPTMEITVRNEGDSERDFSLAVALYDKAGNLVGVAAENPKGKLEPGEETQIKLSFKDFNRYASHAETAQIGLETHID